MCFSNSQVMLMMAVRNGQSAKVLISRASEPDDQSLSNDDQLLDCAICMDKIVDPCLLPCSHTFCQQCLVRHYEYSSRCIADQEAEEHKVINCPACRQTWPLPAGIHSNQQPPSAPPEYHFNRAHMNESICCPSSFTTSDVNSLSC